MGILELIVVLITIAGLFIWNRAEGRADIRHMDNKLDSMRNLIDAIREETKAIHMEMKDFHNRLCEIEERRSK
jgi:predicted  nucleic acid-binding Zn-ribbon protein